MCLRNTKKHLLSWSLCSILLVSLLFGSLNLGCYASETSSGSEIEGPFEYTEQYVKKNFNAICRYVVKWNAIISDSVIGTWENFTNWLDSSGNGDIWEQHPHSPIRNTGEVEVPEEVLEVLNQYIIYQIQATPLSYTECYINSYNFLSPELFPNYQMYVSVKEHIRSRDGYSLIYPYRANASFQYVIATYYDRSDLNFVGTTTAGAFTNVHGYIGWTELTASNLISTADECVKVNTNGTVQDLSTLPSISSTALYNGAMGSTANNGTYNKFYVFSNYDKNELVYVFASLNALKNYNAGQPQPYYLTSDGLANNMSNWTVGSGTINTGTLSNANSSYSNVVNNIQTGWTAEQVLALVDKISSSSGSGSGSDDDDNPFSFLGEIGDLIRDLVTGVGDLLTDLVGSLVDVVLGTKQEDGTRSGGIIGLITDILSSLTGLINTNIGDFLSAVFGWLPTEFVTIFKAMLIFGIFFSIWKLIRG